MADKIAAIMELWLVKEDLDFGKYGSKSIEAANCDRSKDAVEDPEQWGDFKDCVHVIEYSAYEQAVTKYDEVAKERDEYKTKCERDIGSSAFDKVVEENERLKMVLKGAGEVISWYATPGIHERWKAEEWLIKNEVSRDSV